MKRTLRLVLVILVVSSLALTCFATNDTLSVTDATAEPGDVVYLTLMLNQKTVGNSVGVSTAYDSSILTPVPASSSWENSGTLQDFNKQGAGVWAIKTAKDLQGVVCVLAFQVNESAAFTETAVECTLIVKNDGNEVGTYTAEAVISYDCDHNYSDWKDIGKLGHSRTCSNCDAVNTESHSWDEGVVSAKPGDSKTNLMTYTCQICGGTNVMEFAANEETVPTAPTVPMVTQPVATNPTLPTAPTEPLTPATRPAEETTAPTEHVYLPTSPTTGSNPGTSNNPNGNGNQDGREPTKETTPYQDYNQPPEDADDHSGHSHGTPEEAPIDVPFITGNSQETTAEEHVHTENELIHEHEHTSISVATVCAVVGVLVVIVAAAVYFTKKKH